MPTRSIDLPSRVRADMRTLHTAYVEVVSYLRGQCLAPTCDPSEFDNTVERATKALYEMARPWRETATGIRAIFDLGTFAITPQSPVMIGPFDLTFICPHHLLPVIGRAHVAYQPKEVVLGLSKLVRIAQMLAERAIAQEDLTALIALVLGAQVPADMQAVPCFVSRGSMVAISARHTCMECRGVETAGTFTHTAVRQGEFIDDRELRDWFWRNYEHKQIA